MVDDLTSLSMEELRSRRAESQAIEVGLSFVRRLAQGRLDIVAAEQRRRTAGGEPVDTDHLVENLSAVLGDHHVAPGSGRLPQLLSPDMNEVDTTELDAIGPVSNLAEASDAELAELVERLSAYEAAVSVRRRELFELIDALQAEITRRYKTGEASVETLLK